jgi:uncharacterized membrane protein
MTHRIAHFADRAHLDSRTISRVQSAVIFGSISSGLLACALGAFIYDLGRVVAAW